MNSIIILITTTLFLTSCTPTRLPLSTVKVTTYIATQSHRSPHSKTTCNNTYRTVLVGGCFDILHNAHHDYLRLSRERGEYLVVALESDESIIAYKKRQPVFNQTQRAANLAANRYVDEVVLLPKLGGYNDYMQMVLDICPDVIAVTKGDPQIDNIKKQAKAMGAELVEVIGLVDGISTTELIRKIKNM